MGRGLIVALALAAAPLGSAHAAAPDDTALAPLATRPALLAPARQLNTEMVVRDWVLCISRSVAEELVHAREAGVETATKVYADLKAAKSCGRFAELKVILQEPLYAASLEGAGEAAAYGALVSISGGWANAFLVTGGIPAE